MNRGPSAFRGTVLAAAFLIDVPLLGETEARQRVVALWTDQLSVRRLPDGRWLVVLGTPVSVRAERAPGTPLRGHQDGLCTPELSTDPGVLASTAHGRVERHRIDELPLVDLTGWVDLTGLVVHRLVPAGRPSEPVVTPVSTTPPEPDLRAMARIGRRSSRTDRVLRKARTVAGGGSRPRVSVLPTLVAAVASFVLVVVSFGLVLSFGASVTLPFLAVSATLGGALIRGVGNVESRSTGRVAHPAAGRPHPIRELFARLTLRTPLAKFVGTRHERYLRRLTEQFRRQQWDDALREAIALGSEAGALSLALPRRRTTALSPTARRSGGGGSVAYGKDVHSHLQGMYREAAAKLEQAGRIEEAAFVHADLLGDPAAAVALLELHNRLRLAAELAEGRGLAADLVVRQWWLAQERDRAVDVARLRGAFTAAIARLSSVDSEQARELRGAWVRDRQAAGDHLGAVEAAWPEESLRREVLTTIHSGMALGGPTAARLLAHLAAQWPTVDAVRGALALLDTDHEEFASAREQFVTALSELTGRDPGVDRHLSTAALRALLRDGLPADLVPGRQVLARLRKRADPLLVADLVPVATRRPAIAGPLGIGATAEQGQLPVHDAVTLGGKAILVAHGELGLRLLTLDGRVRARWDVPTHRLVMADHGGAALLVGHYGDTSQVHVLDLATRRVRWWAALRVQDIVSSYDGSLVVVVDDGGLAFLDVHAGRPTIVWREFDGDTVIHSVARSPSSLAALVTLTPPTRGVSPRRELWRWELPSMTLRSRPVVESAHTSGVLLASAAAFEQTGDQVTASGDVLAVSTCESAHTLVSLFNPPRREPLLTATFPSLGRMAVRSHADILTLWDEEGRILAADRQHGRPLARLRTML